MTKEKMVKANREWVQEDLANFILETAKQHEESGINTKKTHLGDYQMNLSIQEAAKEVCSDSLWFPVWLLLSQNWNDALHWAENLESYQREPKE